MKLRSCLALLCLLAVALGAHAVPPAPSPLAPANGASVTVPATISWSAVTDPGGAAIVAYNWKLSPSSSFTPVVRMDSTNGDVTQDVVSGLANGTYFWQVQAVNNIGQQGPWSEARSFVVAGTGPGTPGTPVLEPTQGYSTFHPWESVTTRWSSAAGAVTYRLEVSNDPNFPLGPVPPGIQTFWFDNVVPTGFTYVHTATGNWFARVFATDAEFAGGVRSLASNVIQFSVFYDNPIGPPPALVAPLGNPTLTLPVTLTWAHVPNPQSSGYVLEVAKDANFSNIEFFYNQFTDPAAVMLSLTPGQKFWRVLSQHGLASPTTNAITAWSETGTFTLSSASATPVSIAPEGNPERRLYSGASGRVALQLSAAVPAGGASVALASSHPALVPVPASFAMPGNIAWGDFPITAGQVSVPTAVTLTATLNGVSVSNQLTLLPPTLNDDPLQAGPTRATGGATMSGWVDLEGGGLAGPGGALVSLSSSSPAAVVPASVTIPEGFSGTAFAIQTSAVSTTTIATISASFNGASAQWKITLTPGPAPTSLLIRPMSTTNGSQGTVTAAEGVGFDQLMQLASSNPALAGVPASVTVRAGSGIGSFPIATAAVSEPTVVNLSVTGGGVTLSAPLTLYPVLPLLSALAVSPTSVVGGDAATGTVTLTGPAPASGVAINLGSSLPHAASVPASITVPGGATSATFPVSTFPSDTTTAQLSAALDNVVRFAAIGVNPPTPGTTLAAIAVSPASVVGGNSSTGTVTLSAAAPAGGAVVSLADNSNAASVPASVTVPAGATSASFTVTTSAVASSTPVTITGSFGGVSQTANLTVNPPAPGAPSLQSPARDATPAQPVAFDWSDVPGAVRYEIQVDDSSTPAAPFIASQIVSASQVAIGGLPARRLWWRVRAQNSAGVFGPFSETRRFTPQAAAAAPSLASISVNPSSVVGPASSTGTTTLTAPAPSGGAVVTLSSSAPGVAAVPASVTVPAGSTGASFTVTTVAVNAPTSVTLTGAYGGATRTATLAVNPQGANAILTVTATGRGGERVLSTPAGINVAVGTTGSVGFPVNTSIRLSATNGRAVFWSGACSSGGNKTASCTFSLTGNATVNANVQ